MAMGSPSWQLIASVTRNEWDLNPNVFVSYTNGLAKCNTDAILSQPHKDGRGSKKWG